MLVPATYGWPGGMSEPIKVNESLSSWECITFVLDLVRRSLHGDVPERHEAFAASQGSVFDW